MDWDAAINQKYELIRQQQASEAALRASQTRQNDATTATIAPESKAKVGLLGAQTGLTGAQMGLTNMQTQWYGPEAQARIGLAGAQANNANMNAFATREQGISGQRLNQLSDANWLAAVGVSQGKVDDPLDPASNVKLPTRAAISAPALAPTGPYKSSVNLPKIGTTGSGSSILDNGLGMKYRRTPISGFGAMVEPLP